MAAHKLPARAVEDYRAGVHGAALHDKGSTSAPSCVTCHGSHSAVPPGFRSVATVCGSCHPRNQEAHARSAHGGPLSRGCIECHGNHRVEHPGPALFDGACRRCHAAGSPADRVAVRTRDLLVQSGDRLAALAARAERLAALGHSTARLRRSVAGARDLLLEVRPELHSFRDADVESARARLEATLAAVDREAAAQEDWERLSRLSLALVCSFFIAAAALFHALVRAYESEE
jgi:hypothetical protein